MKGAATALDTRSLAAASPVPVTLPGTGILTSRLGLGCAELYNEPRAARRRRLLEEAFDAGIRHFDVAPMYGLGIGERELGRLARSRREQIVIATKFGIVPTPTARAIGRVQGPIRRVLAASPQLRSRARSSAAGPASGATGSFLYHAPGFRAESARRSLERSLRELQTDYLDLLLLHDPRPGTVDGEELHAYLEQAQASGQIRAWGLAGERQPTLATASQLPGKPPVLQLRDSILDPSPRPAPPTSAIITFGVLGGAIHAVRSHLGRDPERRDAWSKVVGRDCCDPEVLARLLLAWATRANPDGVVLFGTTRSEHIRSGVAALAESEDRLDTFVELVRSELGGAPVPRAED
jgi:D-threo-aldose 1-dehydrogenase